MFSIKKKHPDAQTFLFIADLHSLTTAFDLEHAQIKFDGKIGKNTFEIAKYLISSGIKTQDKTILFIQSEVAEHS